MKIFHSVCNSIDAEDLNTVKKYCDENVKKCHHITLSGKKKL